MKSTNMLLGSIFFNQQNVMSVLSNSSYWPKMLIGVAELEAAVAAMEPPGHRRCLDDPFVIAYRLVAAWAASAVLQGSLGIILFVSLTQKEHKQPARRKGRTTNILRKQGTIRRTAPSAPWHSLT